MPAPLLWAIKEIHPDDDYILIDGDKRARVHPTNEVRQGCPLSPLLFTSMTWAEIFPIYINDMGSEGIRGAMTGGKVHGVSYMLYMQMT
eukprot:1149681-Pelagomonas_calceolata.AAC.2